VSKEISNEISMKLRVGKRSKLTSNGDSDDERIVLLIKSIEDVRNWIIIRDRCTDESKFVWDVFHALKKFKTITWSFSGRLKLMMKVGMASSRWRREIWVSVVQSSFVVEQETNWDWISSVKEE
jgi:hypothetical protein